MGDKLFSAQRSDEGHESQAVTVSEFLSQARRMVESRLSGYAIEGEIGRFGRHASGHCYFSVKDASAQLDCVMFRRHASALNCDPAVGDHVRIEGSASIYEQRGQFQFVVHSLKPAGKGGLYEQFVLLKGRLEKEGLFDRSRKRPPPKWPRCVGVLASPDGAAVRDVLRTLRKRMPKIPVVIYPALTQGKAAPEQIAAALGTASDEMRCDTLILCRGGGSMEDLWAYNDEGVARAIAACSVPVVTGIGHEIDETIADYVADVRMPTPTAAAVRAVPDRMAELRHLETLVGRLRERTSSGYDRMAQHLDYMVRSLRQPSEMLASAGQRLDLLATRLAREPNGAVKTARSCLQALARRLCPGDAVLEREGGRLEESVRRLQRETVLALGELRDRTDKAAFRLSSFDSRKTLARGYSLVWAPDGRLLCSANGLAEGDRLTIQFAEGKTVAKVDAPVKKG